MDNFECLERFDQAHSAMVDKLFWIAGSIENRDLRGLLEDMDDKQFKKCFPDIAASPYIKEYRKDKQIMQAFVDHRKMGLVAEVHVPEVFKIRYEKGRPVSWQSSGGICLIEYVYSETMEGLLTEVEKAADRVFKYCLKKDKKKILAVKESR